MTDTQYLEIIVRLEQQVKRQERIIDALLEQINNAKQVNLVTAKNTVDDPKGEEEVEK